MNPSNYMSHVTIDKAGRLSGFKGEELYPCCEYCQELLSEEEVNDPTSYNYLPDPCSPLPNMVILFHKRCWNRVHDCSKCNQHTLIQRDTVSYCIASTCRYLKPSRKRKLDTQSKTSKKTKVDGGSVDSVLIHVTYDSGHAVYIVPVEKLKSLADGILPDILESLKRQNGWHAEDLEAKGCKEDIFVFDYLSFLLGLYVGNVDDFCLLYPDMKGKVTAEDSGIIKREYKADDSFDMSSVQISYFFSRDEHCM